MYCSKEDVLAMVPEHELSQLTAESDGVIDDVVLNKAIRDACATVDSYLAKVHAVPIADPVPNKVNQLAVTIAIYNLYSRRTLENKVVKDNYDDAIRFLERAARNEVTIGASVPPAPAPSPSSSTVVTAADRMFTSKTMRGF